MTLPILFHQHSERMIRLRHVVLVTVLAIRTLNTVGEERDFGLVKWVNSQKNGSFNSKLEIKQIPGDEQGTLGIFAKESIEENEVLSSIPWSLLIESDVEDEEDSLDGSIDCGTVRNLAKELKLGQSSTYAPYVQYLLSLRQGQLPSAWSDLGKGILLDILGGEDQQLPPGSIVSMLDSEWFEACGGDLQDELLSRAAELVMQKEDQDLMVPIYDLFQHRNGDYTNIKTEIELGKYHKTIASRPIEQGEQLYNSHDLCEECNEYAIEQGYGTAELFRDHGIIEQYPQRWSFQPGAIEVETESGASYVYSVENIRFHLLQDAETGNISVDWHKSIKFDDPGRNYIRRIFRRELRRLYRFKNVKYTDMSNPFNVPQYEWDMTWKYFDTLVNVFQYAIHSLVNDGSNAKESCSPGQSSSAGVCKADAIDLYQVHYHDLGWEVDDIDYIEPTCAKSQIVELQEYNIIDTRQSNYQKLSFWERESDDDICMNIENTLQICSTYRPHYHEFFVHYPALFIQEIKRVIFIGGGDAMLLHEVLKYPSLEKVVGLELDQQVTRKSFNYFKSQPHWDDPRVEWWYGDATKSLPLLPQDYWGSFDLVLVDLSETVMSMSVTGELDIFGAVAQLLTPSGIMVKNEPYIDQFSKFFDHTIHIYYGTPKICTQVLVMGSNYVDFLRAPVKEHPEIQRLLLEPLDDPSDRYKYMHDYRHNNATAQGKCEMKEGVIETQHGKKAGILDVIEAENISLDLTKTSDVEANIYSIVREQGLTPVSELSQSSDNFIVVVMKEGYVVARLFPNEKYCALDVHLWGAFGKSLALRSALTEALESQSVSKFRIVAGGMFGSSTLEEDKKEIGIQVTQQRNCKSEETKSSTMDGDSSIKVALVESLDLIKADKDNLKAAVLCGYQAKNDCASLDLLASSDAGSVFPIWACPTLKDLDAADMDLEKMYECEKQIESVLASNIADEKEIDVFVVDSSATYEMAQILNSILSYPDHREEVLSDRHFFVSFFSGENERWRRELVEQIRKFQHSEPKFRVEISISPSLGLDLLYCGDRAFERLRQLELELEKKLPGIEVTSIKGGLHFFDPEYNMVEFPESAYDRNPATIQQTSQEALGRQSIFQFVSSPEKRITLEKAMSCLDTALATESSSTTTKYDSVGDGALVLKQAKDMMAIMVWDGQDHVDVNIFRVNQDEQLANSFSETFLELCEDLQSYLRDDQPRGTGNVMQFSYESQFR